MRILSNNIVYWVLLMLHKEGGTPPVSRFRITQTGALRVTQDGSERVTQGQGT